MSNQVQYEQLIQTFLPDARLLDVSTLTGGISAQTSHLTVLLPDSKKRQFVVRLHGEADRASNPRIAFDEFRLLEALYQSDVHCAKPVYVDDTVFDIPCIVLEYVEGTTDFPEHDFDSAIRQMAEELAKIHGISDASTCFDFLPPQVNRFKSLSGERPAEIDDSLQEGQIRDVLEAVWELPQLNQPVLLHGDYWVGNVLWKEDKLVAVIDWEDAMIGEPLADLGDIRIATLWSSGRDAMTLFTEHYQSIMLHLDYSQLPYWDLCAALRPIPRFSEWANNPEHEKNMRREHHYFVNQAMSRL